MKKKKSIAVAVVLALILLIGGLLAYFTDTDTKTNQFELGGEVDIQLTEPGWTALTDTDTDGIPDVAEGIHPGTTVTKDPTVTNESQDTPAYVFVEAIVPQYNAGTAQSPDYQPLFILNNSTSGDATTTTGTGNGPNSGWVLVDTVVDSTNHNVKYIFGYSSNGTTMTQLAGGATTSNSASPFSSVTLDSTLTAEQAADVLGDGTNTGVDDIVVNAYGIQTDGFTSSTPAQVWSALNS